MAREGEQVRFPQLEVSCSPSFVVEKSSFFPNWDRLPSPNEVQARVKEQQLAGVYSDQEGPHPMAAPYACQPPASFEEMGLFVKWGGSVQLSEAQSLYAIRQFLKGDVPVPEVYGWHTEGNVRYIYMEYVNGTSLEQVWRIMTIFQCLRQVEQHPKDPFVGNVTKGPLYDRAFHVNYMHEAGPFATVRDFHDWFTSLHRRPMSDPYSVPVEPFRYDLPDDCAIKFTHGDLHRSNIIVTPTPPYRILAVVDWEQSGWLPEYWESRKAQYTADRGESWSTTYLPEILDQRASIWEPWDYYTSSMGC
ncbi:phosphotransferase enzyme family protein [Aspergillus homomorphus CBS 101889]|uniref:Phosphotransferase enzyme family protein n=1 Tax=Aspergillus homomorphus (strain CBS 101889) TaxID=1450537 RepID=A0A395HKT3_ASPHC|nr:phosphotransferase enzyme family protein [Aspergillus homomorphus CBS 101889]RAL08561.1 phosphotransferase enzyme family protein [Aspergillus homomorphus CBS 101889]